MKIGCVAICLDNEKKVLMFLNNNNGKSKWCLPMGFQQNEESLANCSLRGVKESTGYYVELAEKLYKKTNYLDDEIIKSHYYEVKIIAKDSSFKSDQVERVEWVDIDRLKTEDFLYPEDKYLIKSFIKRKIREDYKNRMTKINKEMRG